MNNDDIEGDIVTPEFLERNKGNLNLGMNAAGHIRFVQIQINSVVNFLAERNILEDQHVYDAQTYEIWQTVFSAHLGYGKNPIYVVEYRSVLEELGLKENDFPKLIRMLTLEQKKLIEYAIYHHATEHLRWLSMRNCNHYRRAFDKLSEIMQKLRDAEKSRREAEESACSNPMNR